MESINTRLLILRKACELNQTEFSKILGITRSGIADIESGRRKVTDKHLVMISNWDQKKVNIDWLRTGEGDMFLNNTSDDQLSKEVEKILIHPNPSVKKEAIRLISLMDEKELMVFYKYASKLVAAYNPESNEVKKTDSVEMLDGPAEEMAYDEYIKNTLNSAGNTDSSVLNGLGGTSNDTSDIDKASGE